MHMLVHAIALHPGHSSLLDSQARYELKIFNLSGLVWWVDTIPVLVVSFRFFFNTGDMFVGWMQLSKHIVCFQLVACFQNVEKTSHNHSCTCRSGRGDSYTWQLVFRCALP